MKRNRNKYNGNTVRYSRLSGVWRQMNYRCYNPKADNYQRYGGKGVTVCDEWRNDFSSFLEWVLSNGYKEGLTLDRIDSLKPYSPDNCRWVTYYIQEQNKGIGINNTTGCKGVCPHPDGYRAYLTRNGVRVELGVYNKLEDAIYIRKQAEKRYKLTGQLSA